METLADINLNNRKITHHSSTIPLLSLHIYILHWRIIDQIS